MRQHLVGGVVALLLLAPVLLSGGQSVIRADTDRISIDAEDVPLGTFFRELSGVVEIDMLVISPEAQRTPFTLKLMNVHPAVGLQRVLEEAEVNFGISGGEGGEPLRIIVGDVGNVTRASSGLHGQGDTTQDEAESAIPEGVDVAADPELDTAPEWDESPQRGRATGTATSQTRPPLRYATGSARPAPGSAYVPGTPPTVEEPTEIPDEAPSTSSGSKPEPLRERFVGTVSGPASATEDARLGRPAMDRQVATVGVLLFTGLCLGVALVPSSRS